MSKQALYRILRPKTFDGIVGQEHITEVLKKQVEKAQPAHAYLFYGPRGSGKTSSSRILANALNCLNPQNGSPCGECQVCKAFAADAFVDIIEMDAASNSSVEDVREMLDKVPLMPTSGKYKVYIIDEVHMFSKSAFNALLKTIEEPPAHTVFIFATTELSKVPQTIFSRTQKFGFKRLTKEIIEPYITNLLDEMKIAYEPKAVSRITVFADGAMRDALSLLDQCISYGDVTTQAVTKILGIPSEEMTELLCNAIMDENISEAVKITNELLNDGVAASEILTGCSSRFTEILIENANDSARRDKILAAIWALNQTQGLVKYTNVQSAVTIAGVIEAAKSYASPPDKNLYTAVRKLRSDVDKIGGRETSAPADFSTGYVSNESNEQLIARIDHLEARLTKAAQVYKQMSLSLSQLKAQTDHLKEKVNMGYAPVNIKAQSQPVKDSPNGGADFQIKTFDVKDVTSILYPTPQAQLKALQELGLAENTMLRPFMNNIDHLEVKDGKILFFVNREDIKMMQGLLREDFKKSLDTVLNEIYGSVPEVEFVEIEEEKSDPAEVEKYLKEVGAANVELVHGSLSNTNDDEIM